ncbi:hypothetical protein S83_026333 [Arachis hypogaea]
MTTVVFFLSSGNACWLDTSKGRAISSKIKLIWRTCDEIFVAVWFIQQIWYYVGNLLAEVQRNLSFVSLELKWVTPEQNLVSQYLEDQ